MPESRAITAPAPVTDRRSALAVNSLALAASSLVTGLLGMVFWAATARTFPVAEIGRGSAAISTATTLGTLANQGIGGMYERFLPVAGTRARRLLASSSALAFLLAVLLGAGFVLVGAGDRVLMTPFERWSFPLVTGVLAAFALQDNLLTGFRRASYAAVKNVVHAVAKLGLVIAVAAIGTGFAIVLAWTVPAALAAGVVLVWVFRRALRAEEFARPPDLPPTAGLVEFFGATYGITVVSALPPLVIPLIVIHALGAEANGYFTMAWTIITALMLLITMIVGPFVAEAAAHPERLASLTRRVVLLLGGVAGGGALFLLVGAPIVLSWLGPQYGVEGTGLVRVMAASTVLAVVPVLYSALARVHRRLRLAVAVQIIMTVTIVGGCVLLVPTMGLPGIGLAYVVTEAVAGAIVLVPLIRLLRAGRRSDQGSTPIGELDP
ncbi:lipopolysaccharide biosynthesis protein [Actinomycetospora flava]|uniref:Lipopolysaccharide biosynthesis protein n=1 Tax=Actinomycetospora flava TaxID=3129232 RepID=A0ABU8MAB3_9PSEU